MANTIPARGVLNAAEIPAAPPARIRCLGWMEKFFGKKRLNAYMTLAATWTDGPSRPAENPDANAPNPRIILAAANFNDRNLEMVSSDVSSLSAAIVWGIPLPAAP